MRIDDDRARPSCDAALDAGITLFDTADIYGGSRVRASSSGAALGAGRDDVVVATKFGMQVGEGLAARPPTT